MVQLDLKYVSMLNLIQPYVAKGRTVSQSFLAWFLENIYRLDEMVAQDAICDGTYDQGIDGIYVDQAALRIDVLQAKTAQNDTKGVGDTDIKEFKGTLDQLNSKQSVEKLGTETKNRALAKLLERLEIAELVESGYEVRGIFVTNANTDPSADAYVETSGANILIWDRNDIAAAYITDEHAPPPDQTYTFDVFGLDVGTYESGPAKVVIAPLSALQLIELEGIKSGQLFDYNVRRSLGNTKVNKDIRKSIQDKDEHRSFLLYHNGVTIVAESVDTTVTGKITVVRPVVVNGCQSLTSFWEDQKALSSDLRVMARLIELDMHSPVMGKITRNSNNQNGIQARDFQSNNAIQLRLRNEFQQTFGDKIFYRISRGEEPHSSASQVIDNETAARMLLSFDLQEPWSSHQTYRLFDDLHPRIFGRQEVTAKRILALSDIYSVVEGKLAALQHELFAKYALTRYYLLYLLSRALENDEQGKRLFFKPEEFVSSPEARVQLRTAIGDILNDLIIDLNAEVELREADDNIFDFKQDLKSPAAVRKFTADILGSYQKAVIRHRAPSFSEAWEAAGHDTESTSQPPTP